MGSETQLKVHDHRKIHSGVYKQKAGSPELIEVPPMKFILQEGTAELDASGRPTDPWVIWKTVNQLKRITKDRLGYQFTLMPREVVWHAQVQGDTWQFTDMMMVPDLVDQAMYEEARNSVAGRYRNQLLPETELAVLTQGLSVQMLHVGHYREVGRTEEAIRAFAAANGYEICGDRRQIYVNAPDCYPTPDSWESIIRFPVKAV